MISREETEKLHRVLIESFGGTQGIRDITALESALSRPFQTFDNTELYPTPIEKAASLIESILNNHPFVDGNKRTGYTLMRLFLISNTLDIIATLNEKYDFVIGIASGKKRYEEIVMWLESHTEKQTGG
jgi:death-on-curing protein